MIKEMKKYKLWERKQADLENKLTELLKMKKIIEIYNSEELKSERYTIEKKYSGLGTGSKEMRGMYNRSIKTKRESLTYI